MILRRPASLSARAHAMFFLGMRRQPTCRSSRRDSAEDPRLALPRVDDVTVGRGRVQIQRFPRCRAAPFFSRACVQHNLSAVLLIACGNCLVGVYDGGASTPPNAIVKFEPDWVPSICSRPASPRLSLCLESKSPLGYLWGVKFFLLPPPMGGAAGRCFIPPLSSHHPPGCAACSAAPPAALPALPWFLVFLPPPPCCAGFGIQSLHGIH